ncbi:MAG: hypothetical protein V4677_14785 [Bacteroidota bacterium]
MKNYILLISLLTITFSCRQTDNIENSQSPKDTIYSNPMAGHMALTGNDTILELKVKLIDHLDSVKEKVVYCGGFEIRWNCRFQVIEVIKGPYNRSEISISILCPLEMIESKWLQNEKTYVYRLKRGSNTIYERGQKEKHVPADFYEIL